MELLYLVIAVTVITSVMAFGNRSMFSRLCFDPFVMNNGKNKYRFLSYALIHADWPHLLINMFVLYSFGEIVMYSFGYHFAWKALPYFLMLYAGGTFVSVIPSFLKNRANPYYTAVGASGAVSAVVFSSILMFPEGEIMFLLLPVPMPSYVFGLLYLVYSWYMAKKGKDNIGHDAHFWGAVFGLAFTGLLKPSLFVSFFEQLFY